MVEARVLDLCEVLGYREDSGDQIDNVSSSLRNLGNTCYLNALLHVFARVPSLQRWCATHQERFRGDSTHVPGCALCGMALDLSYLTANVDNAPLSPVTVRQRGVWSYGRLDNVEQHDAHDAFCLLVDACEEVDARCARALGLPPILKNGGTNSVRYSTPFWKAFGGIHLSTTICKACGHRAPQYEMWHSLSLALPAAPTTLEQVLANHWGTEPLQCENDRCDECNTAQQREKDVQLVRWPQVLVVHLKRWDVISMAPFVQQKVPTKIHFEVILPVEVRRPPYYLRGVVVHHGGAGIGHYFAYVRAPDNFWYLCDDWRRPRLVSVDEVLAAEAYMLFYEQ